MLKFRFPKNKKEPIDMKIDKQSTVPLYLQLKNILVSEIESNLDINDKLETEREICDRYGVSRTTVRQALDALEKERYIYKVHGKGNFIRQRRVEQNLVKFYSFTDEMIKIGRTPRSEVVSFSLEGMSKKVAAKLEQEPDDLVYKLTRVRLADEVPMIYETTYLPYDIFKGMSKEALQQRSMYDIFRADFHITMTSAEESLEAVPANKLESVYLDIPEHLPCLKIERITYDHDRIVEYTLSVARGDQFKYRINLQNDTL